MFDKTLGTVYLIIYGALLLFCVVVTFTTNIGLWGIAGIAGFAWLMWRQVAALRS